MKKLLLLIVGTIFALCIAEILSRFYLPLPLRYDMVSAQNKRVECYEPSFFGGYRPKSNTCGRDDNGLLASTQSPSGILILGDSLSTSDGWARALQKRYPKRIINGSVSGYDTCQELHWFRELDKRIQIDAVILQMCPNDIGGSPVLVPKDDHTYRYFTGSRAFDFPRWILRSHLLSYFMFQYAIENIAAPLEEDPVQIEQHTRQCLRELRNEVGNRPLHIIIFPVLSDDQNEHLKGWNSEQQLKSIAQDVGVSYLFLRDSMEGMAFSSLRERPDDHVHPSAEGSISLLETIVPFLQKDSRLTFE
ncbi:MAG: SGNH/GDSL hydrolase family protein [Myxococcota bacterium]|nr:SGNH/GDSL hydrolase family protein [Myxococcota bacterium]